MTRHIELSVAGPTYTGGLSRMEVQPFEPDIHDAPGLYLQHVEGCGYTPFELTPDEAETLAAHLMAAARETREAFKRS